MNDIKAMTLYKQGLAALAKIDSLLAGARARQSARVAANCETRKAA